MIVIPKAEPLLFEEAIAGGKEHIIGKQAEL